MTTRTKEIWKPIPNYEGYYEASSLGRIRSVDRVVKNGNWTKPVRGRVLKVCVNDGYIYCSLSKDGKVKQQKVHRLVAITFIPNPDNLPYINHKNEDKGDNRVENLEWCTKWHNEHYGTFQEKAKSGVRRVNGRPVVQYDVNGNVIREYECIVDVRKYGFSDDSVGDCCRDELTRHRGYIFRYKGDPFFVRKRKNNIIVKKYDGDGNLLCEYESIKDAEQHNGYGSYVLRKFHLAGESEVIKDGCRYVFVHN